MHHQECEGPQGEVRTPRPAGIPIKRQTIPFLLRDISRQTIRVVDSDAVVVSHRVDPGVDSIHSWDRLQDDMLGGPAYPLEEVEMVYVGPLINRNRKCIVYEHLSFILAKTVE